MFDPGLTAFVDRDVEASRETLDAMLYHWPGEGEVPILRAAADYGAAGRRARLDIETLLAELLERIDVLVDAGHRRSDAEALRVRVVRAVILSYVEPAPRV